MEHKLDESDQLMIIIEGYIPLLSQKLIDLRIQNFEELYRFGV